MLLNLVFWIVRWIIKETLTPRHALKEFVQESVIYNSFRQILMHLSSYSLKGPWRKRIRGGTAGPPAWPPAYGVHDDALYKSTAFTFFTFLKPYPHWRLKRLKGDYSRQCGRGLSSILHNRPAFWFKKLVQWNTCMYMSIHVRRTSFLKRFLDRVS